MTDQMRQDFEAWYFDGEAVSMGIRTPHGYKYIAAQSAWLAWCAATAQATADDKDDLTVVYMSGLEDGKALRAQPVQGDCQTGRCKYFCGKPECIPNSIQPNTGTDDDYWRSLVIKYEALVAKFKHDNSAIAVAVKVERERCAMVCDGLANEFGGVAAGPFVTDFGKHTHQSMAAGAKNCADAIRQGGAKCA